MKLSSFVALTAMAFAVVDCGPRDFTASPTETFYNKEEKLVAIEGPAEHIDSNSWDIEKVGNEQEHPNSTPVYKCKLSFDEEENYPLQSERFEDVCTNKKTKNKKFMASLVKGKCKWMTFSDAFERIKRIHSGLVNDLKLSKGARVGIYIPNSPEWMLLDYACIRGGFVSVPINPRSTKTEVSHIISNSKIQTLFFGPEQQETVGTLELCGIDLVLVKDEISTTQTDYKTLKSIEESFPNVSCPAVQLTGDDVFSIIYTSGTTGNNPKGALMTHRALASKLRGIEILSKAGKIPNFYSSDVRYFSYLPLCHVLERILQHFLLNAVGSVGFFGGNRDELLKEMALVAPTFLAAVPKVLNTIYNDAQMKIESSPKLKSLFEYLLAHKNDDGLFHRTLRNSILWPARRKFGGKISSILTGGAAINAQVQEFLSFFFGCPIHQGYGLTETFGASFITWSGDEDSGHVGIPLPFTQFKLVPVKDNETYLEIFISDISLFSGYLNENGDLEQRKDQWHPTGDMGEIDSKGRLKIIGRINGSFKLCTGEFVVPTVVEEAIKASITGVIDAFVCSSADNTATVAVISIAKDSKSPLSKFDILKAFKNLRQQHLQIKSYEIPVAVHLTTDEWLNDPGLYTPSMKQKRIGIAKKYADAIAQLEVPKTQPTTKTAVKK